MICGEDNTATSTLRAFHLCEGNLMGTHRVKLVKREDVAEGTMAFYFEKPPGFQFKPGQYLDVIQINPPEKDDEGIARSLSIASAPFEEELMFATRMRDTAFKRVLKAMPLGTEVEIEGPYGSFVLHNNPARPAMLLAGGIGITPFRSMVVQAAQTRLPHRMILVFCNRRPEDAAFLEELLKLQSLNENFTLIGLMTEMDKSQRSWDGEKGRLSAELLMRHSKPFANPIYYVVGPPGMVDAVHSMLNEAGINDDDIRSEEFGGY
jgi:ferredoxin-NADP reductase